MWGIPTYIWRECEKMKTYKNTKVFTDDIEESAWEQVKEVTDQEFMKDSKIRVMPDCHAGAGCVIGFTAEIKGKIVPNLVGVDIGCGMRCVKITEKNLDFAKLDDVIHKYVPSGFAVRSTEHDNLQYVDLDKLTISDSPYVNWHRLHLSLGTLGGGNHFLEVDKSKNGDYFLVVHSGSRNLGVQVAKYHQDVAIKECNSHKNELSIIIDNLKAQGRFKEIESTIKEYRRAHSSPTNALCYVSGDSMKAYLNDMAITQKFAYYNRKTMLDVIMNKMGWTEVDSFDSIHNYVDIEHNIIRKGATLLIRDRN
jgi:RNA-splicing ligase RtcB